MSFHVETIFGLSESYATAEAAHGVADELGLRVVEVSSEQEGTMSAATTIETADTMPATRPRVLVLEHKTTSEDCGPGSTFWKRLRLDGQASGYMVGARALGYEPDGILYDVLRKPALRPYEASAKRKAAETPEEYRDRCLADIAERPDYYYQRGTVVRLEDEERDAAFDLWQTAEQIRLSRNAERWPRNVDACMQYNRACDYWSVCAGEQSIDDPLHFAPHASPLREAAADDGKTHLPILSASSAKKYRACARSYFYAYERGLRPVAQQAAALFFGKRIHLGLETWLTSGMDLDAAIAAMLAGGEYDHEAAKAEAMLRGYHARWSSEPLQVVAVEQDFQAALVNPATGAKSRTWTHAGRLDAIVRV